MKINKLFHWLYGALMCLPLLGVLFTSLYVTFNPNAKDSYSQNNVYETIPIYYESNEVNSVSDLVPGNIYRYEVHNNATRDIFVMCDLILPSEGFTLHNYSVEQPIPYFKVYTNNYLTILYVAQSEIYSNPYNLGSFFFVFNYASYDLSSIISNISQANVQVVKEYVEQTLYEGTLDNAFTYAINEINNNPLYNWAQNSFLVAPIAFVTGLFGLTQTSPVVTLLSYWLTISIVWLVFDLIMYIPLLVHRWLDKGVLS